MPTLPSVRTAIPGRHPVQREGLSFRDAFRVVLPVLYLPLSHVCPLTEPRGPLMGMFASRPLVTQCESPPPNSCGPSSFFPEISGFPPFSFCLPPSEFLAFFFVHYLVFSGAYAEAKMSPFSRRSKLLLETTPQKPLFSGLPPPVLSVVQGVVDCGMREGVVS